MAKVVKQPSIGDASSQQLDKIVVLLQDILILEAMKANGNKEEIRKVLSVGKERINRISNLLKQGQ